MSSFSLSFTYFFLLLLILCSLSSSRVFISSSLLADSLHNHSKISQTISEKSYSSPSSSSLPSLAGSLSTSPSFSFLASASGRYSQPTTNFKRQKGPQRRREDYEESYLSSSREDSSSSLGLTRFHGVLCLVSGAILTVLGLLFFFQPLLLKVGNVSQTTSILSLLSSNPHYIYF